MPARILIALSLVLAGLLSLCLPAASQESRGGVMVIEVESAIGPATLEYLQHSLAEAEERRMQLLVLRLDTPGGLMSTTRDMVKRIRGADVPVAVWVAPQGARAASAGTYLLYASHIAAMAPATNVGAATPVSITGRAQTGDATGEGGGEQLNGDGGQQDEAPSPEETAPDKPEFGGEDMRRKAMNDAVAWLRSLAEETGRNAEWAEQAVREAASLTAAEALEQNVIEYIAADLDSLLEQVDGAEIPVAGAPRMLQTAEQTIERRLPGWRSKLLNVITNPSLAYILLIIGFYGLLLEGYNPGALVPGVVGAISLLLALYALQLLPVNYAGLLLMLLGLILMVAEAFAPSFGVLGIGGIVAFVIGSVILIDTDVPGFEIALELIIAIAATAAVVIFGTVILAVKSWRRPVVSGGREILHARGKVLEPVDAGSGQVWVTGERWQARSREPLPPGTPIRVTGRDGFILQVEPDERADNNQLANEGGEQ